MSQNQSKHFRVLAIAPSTRGFGFAVLEGEETLIDWGVKPVKGDKNAQSLIKVERLITLYQPDVLVMDDTLAKNSRRSARIQMLAKEIIGLVQTRKIKVRQFSGKQLRKVLIGNDRGTKQEMAEMSAAHFPEELASRLPPKRRPWTSEDGRMDIFIAVGLAVAFWMKTLPHVLPPGKNSTAKNREQAFPQPRQGH